MKHQGRKRRNCFFAILDDSQILKDPQSKDFAKKFPNIVKSFSPVTKEHIASLKKEFAETAAKLEKIVEEIESIALQVDWMVGLLKNEGAL